MLRKINKNKNMSNKETYALKGKVKVINETQTFDSGFQKRVFVVTTDGEWPQDIKFEVVKDKCSLLDQFSNGQEVTVNFDVRGNEYNGKYYVNLAAWRIDAVGQVTTAIDGIPF